MNIHQDNIYDAPKSELETESPTSLILKILRVVLWLISMYAALDLMKFILEVLFIGVPYRFYTTAEIVSDLSLNFFRYGQNIIVIALLVSTYKSNKSSFFISTIALIITVGHGFFSFSGLDKLYAQGVDPMPTIFYVALSNIFALCIALYFWKAQKYENRKPSNKS